LSLRKYITKDSIEKTAIERYQENGDITFEDIEREFSLNKVKTQRTLKYFHETQVLFTANNLKAEGTIVLKNTSPQQYILRHTKIDYQQSYGLLSFDDKLDNYNTQEGGQCDGLGHIDNLRAQAYYNGAKHEEIKSSDKLGIHNWADRFIGRGAPDEVLLAFLQSTYEAAATCV
jgi:hypothetical protein